MPSKKYFITFATENYKGASDRIIEQTRLLKIFDILYNYNEDTLQQSTEFWERHGDFIKNNSRGYGYWLWKSFLTMKTLDEMETNDIMMYVDSGCEWNYGGIEKLETYFEMVGKSESGSLAFKLYDESYHMESKWTKSDVFDYFKYSDKMDLQYHATYFILKKNEKTMNMVKTWYEACSNYHLLDDSPIYTPNADIFTEHRHDQSLFSIIRKMNKSLYILTPPYHEVLKEQFPIYDYRNKDYKSVVYTKKTVIHTWTQNVTNMVRTDTDNYWGLGDIIRGTIKLYQLSKKMDFELVVDIQHHPISRFLKNTNTKYSNLVKNNRNNIEFVLPGSLENHIESSNKDIILMLTNDLCDENDITEDCKEFIRNILTPSDFLNEYMEIRKSELTQSEYNILHYRLGDGELVRKNESNSLSEQLEHLQKNKEMNDVLISDSETFKNYTMKNTNDINIFYTKAAHLGYETNPSKIMDTLVELFLIVGAKKIKTHSVYTWISGFVYWIHKIYDIPLEKI